MDRDLVPTYTSPEVIIDQLKDIILAQDKTIQKLEKKNVKLLRKGIKHNSAIMANTMDLLLNRKKHFPEQIILDRSKVGWDELHKQKDILLEIREFIESGNHGPNWPNALSGIIHFLYYVQDTAVDQGGQDKGG